MVFNCRLIRLVLWHIHKCCSFNPKSGSFINIDIWFVNISQQSWIFPNSTDNQSFFYRQLYDQALLFQTFKSNISHLLGLSLYVKQFYLIHNWDPMRCYHSKDLWRCIPHSPKLHHYWSFTIKLFNIIGGGLTTLQRYSQCVLLLRPNGLTVVFVTSGLPITKTILTILADRNNGLHYPLISMASTSFISPLGIVSNAPITILISDTFIYNCYIYSQARSAYIFRFLLILLRCSPGC